MLIIDRYIIIRSIIKKKKGIYRFIDIFDKRIWRKDKIKHLLRILNIKKISVTITSIYRIYYKFKMSLRYTHSFM